MFNYLCSIVYFSIIGGKTVFVDKKKCPPTLVIALTSLRYNASLWMARIMFLGLVHDDGFGVCCGII